MMNFFDKFLGYWMAKKNIFILRYNLKCTYEEKIEIIKNKDQNQAYCYKLNNKTDTLNLKCFNSYFEKEKGISINQYKIKKVNENLLQIYRKLSNNIYYTEYIYFINKNFNTSIGFVKRDKTYLATIFTSYIKVYNK